MSVIILDLGDQYDLKVHEQGHILSSFFIGYIFSNLAAGYVFSRMS